MVKLSVNINKIALIRNSRLSNLPDIYEMAKIAILNGADSITVHPRPDLRHIRPCDVYRLSDITDSTELNIEGNPFEPENENYPGFMTLVHKAKPHQCTLVPDEINQLTSDHGWDLVRDKDTLRPIIKKLKSQGVRVSLFMDPGLEAIQYELAAHIGADRIELYTEEYAKAYGTQGQGEILKKYILAAEIAQSFGLEINAGHDLNLENISMLASSVDLKEVSIGHALIIDSLKYGLGNTVAKYREALA
ncbi:pyridoxine 5'-phosphate synthase [Amphritea sp. HPY]|uniref:pyridoxine 5'-phosphate synthase n=1 Tax=Amphritea sp. HPY TaxID=3421652 RepID=UPI003D7EDD88